MNARYTLTQTLRDALGETAACVATLLDLRKLQPAPVAVTARPRPAVLARRFVFVAALAAVSLAGAAHAHVAPRANVPVVDWADGRLVDVQIRVDGRAAPLYLSPRGDLRHYLEAFAGRNYSIVLRNNTANRIGVLLAVDGLNVVNGRITKQSPNEPMYVLDPWESATIQGWRTSLNEVRRFVFVDEKRSYAARTDQANADMGWIRVLAFREKRLVAIEKYKDGRGQYRDEVGELPWLEAQGDRAKTEAAPGAPSARGEAAPTPTAQRVDGLSKSMASQDAGGSFPGTGWGDRRTDRVEYVNFTPERGATDVLVLRYEYASGLVALGIFPDRDRLRERDGGGLMGFARPPRW